MNYTVNGTEPKLHPTARVAATAALVGDVTLGENASVWYNATLRADNDSITIGKNSNIQDNCVLHADKGQPCVIGQGVTVGHGAIVHACTVEDNCIIGMGCIILNGAVIGSNSIIGAGALVTKNTVIPPYSLVVGSPAKVKRSLTEEEAEHNRSSAQEYVIAAREQL